MLAARSFWMKFMLLTSTCLHWILFMDRQFHFERDTESIRHTEVLEFTALAKALGLLAPGQLLCQPCSVLSSSAPKC